MDVDQQFSLLASREVTYAIEAIANLLPSGKMGSDIQSGSSRQRESAENFCHNGHIKYSRSCYDHLAGKIGVAITDKLVKVRLITPETDTPGYKVTPAGLQWVARLEIDIDE